MRHGFIQLPRDGEWGVSGEPSWRQLERLRFPVHVYGRYGPGADLIIVERYGLLRVHVSVLLRP